MRMFVSSWNVLQAECNLIRAAVSGRSAFALQIVNGSQNIFAQSGKRDPLRPAGRRGYDEIA